MDLDWVVSTARAKDPSLSHEVAEELAAEAVPLAAPGVDAAEIARALLARDGTRDVSSVNVVASAVVEGLAR